MVWKPKSKTITRPNPNQEGKTIKAKYKVNKNGKLATWRPTKRTPEVEKKLEDAFWYNCTDEEACAYAWIWLRTLNDWKEKDEAFSQQVQQWKKVYAFNIKKTSYERATNVKNEDSTKILFRIDDRYKEKQEEKSQTITILDVARIMQERRLSREKWEDPEIIEWK